ncbi:shK domain-like domain-containing protein [Ditylenchus destructor]|uniref:ShK domain-like domain-containing protein n=1 Tax=Ditylenchus destructor TaxID=166010 RepID=A0AAD4NHI1_9BILA|nr:shK domain-like domain-containing protein [Ditylenchus destructor]
MTYWHWSRLVVRHFLVYLFSISPMLHHPNPLAYSQRPKNFMAAIFTLSSHPSLGGISHGGVGAVVLSPPRQHYTAVQPNHNAPVQLKNMLNPSPQHPILNKTTAMIQPTVSKVTPAITHPPPPLHRFGMSHAASNTTTTVVPNKVFKMKRFGKNFKHNDPEEESPKSANNTEVENSTTAPKSTAANKSSSNTSAHSGSSSHTKFTVVTPAPKTTTKHKGNGQGTHTKSQITKAGHSEKNKTSEDAAPEVESDEVEPPSPPLPKSEEGDEETNISRNVSSEHLGHRNGNKGKNKKIHQKGSHLRGGNQNNRNHHMTATEKSITTMLRCQDLETRELIPSAVSCKNTRSDKVCAYLFMEVDMKTGRRDVKCNLQGLEDIAESCRRTCGICCEDINYSCEDDTNGIIDCTKQLDKCHVNKWFGVLSRFCAGSCGLCARSACRDYDNTCRVRKSLCLKEETVDYMRENCARTCGFCIVGDLSERMEGLTETSAAIGSSAGISALARPGGPKPPMLGNLSNINGRMIERPHKMIGGDGGPECIDRATNCTMNEDLCGSPVYSEYMIKFCTRTCLKCDAKRKAAASGSSRSAESAVHRRHHRHYPTQLSNSVRPLTLQAREEPPEILEVINIVDPIAIPPARRKGSLSTDLKKGAGDLKHVQKGHKNKANAIAQCTDNHIKCSQWVTNGLCTNDRYSREQRYRLCAKSCNLC